MTPIVDALIQILDLGGPVVAVLLMVSVVTLAVFLYKLWQFRAAGVGRHKALSDAVTRWDHGETDAARAKLKESNSYLAPVIQQAFDLPTSPEATRRLEGEAEIRFSQLERGFRFLDMVAQIAPLLGLFGTVLGMIEAFQSLQEAGSQVDPSLLAGGIWVALLTTAVGLAIAMPVSAALSWFEARMDAERALADHALRRVLFPSGAPETLIRHAG
ncbi:MotA/TolQ/ExbB proton channel family protein [Thalassococcus sp. S3]|uniref:MotA/TolQ/ExbB proton channel family protein n=1 Tax=Thalassococcus sp. S3 TaxID=2017482 RepID=UPI0010247D1B|nr:MotA/TolQ/ExbB proton channel family protein [Thalassococcus sp. S3]QBF30454.1 flagellar motor protein MotA [Thalassococcus sp. S3]